MKRKSQEIAVVVVMLLTACLAVMAGCEGGANPFTPVPVASAAELEDAEASAAVALALLPPSADPLPTPTPTPEPGGECARCNGTGRIKPDGRIEIACPDCDGDGKLATAEEIYFLVQQAQAEALAKRAEKLKSGLAAGVEPDTSAETWAIADAQERIDRLTKVHSVAPVATERKAVRQAPVWYSSIAAARREAQRTDKPVFVFWETKPCPACDRMFSDVICDPGVFDCLARSFICVKRNVDEADATDRDTADRWLVTTFPSVSIVRADWTAAFKLKYEPDAGKFLRQLEDSLEWARIEEVLRESRASAGERCNCAETGVCTCGDDCQCPNCPRHRRAESAPSTGSGLVRYAVRTTDDDNVEYVAASGPIVTLARWGGSAGGMYQGGYQGGSAGGVGMAYGSAGGQPATYGYQRAYYSAPRSYYNGQPSYGGYQGGGNGWGIGANVGGYGASFSGGYQGGGRTLICDEYGCRYQ